MLKTNSIGKFFTLVTIVTILMGCSIPGISSVPEDTSANDISAARTDAAMTVIAQFTNAVTETKPVVPSVTVPSATVAIVTPTIKTSSQPTTILLPELTLPASATPKKTAQTVTATKTRTKTSATTAEPTQKIIYKWKPTKTKTPYIDVGKLITQSPPDWQKYEPGQDFDVRWTIRNVGGRDWNKEFYFIYEGGTLEPENLTFKYLPINLTVGDGLVFSSLSIR